MAVLPVQRHRARRRRRRAARALSALGLLTAGGVAVGWTVGGPADPAAP